MSVARHKQTIPRPNKKLTLPIARYPIPLSNVHEEKWNLPNLIQSASIICYSVSVFMNLKDLFIAKMPRY